MQNYRTNWFEQNSKFALILANMLGVLLLVLLVEVVLRLFLPCQITTIGGTSCRNGALYGWGFDPYGSIKTSDPDTCEVYLGKANNHGWRDKDREYENTKGAYRILILGDSVTFGAIVPADRVYTQTLEAKLTESGYNVEVINISYVGWGTDQEAEALINEGLLYRPNLIIVQFCMNDLSGNADVSYAFDTSILRSKPFYYTLNENGHLLRHENPFCPRSQGWQFTKGSFKAFAERWINHSEILKQLHEFYVRRGGRCDPRVTKYRVTTNQIGQLQTVLDLGPSSALFQFLNENVGREFTAEQLNSHLSIENEQTKGVVFRVLEDRWFHEYWGKDRYQPKKADGTSYEWRLYFSLMNKINELGIGIGADTVVFPETEEGLYQWDISWHRVSNNRVSKQNYLSGIELIKEAMSKIHVKVIENTVTYQRARNDPHPNIEGNRHMAEDIFGFLMTHYKDKLTKYRKTGQD